MLDSEEKGISRSEMSDAERRLRSRLVQLLSRHGVLRGALSVRMRSCGKAGCKCLRGERHRAVYLVYRERGRYRQVFIPRRQEIRARRWVSRYQEVQELLESLSVMNLERLKRKDGGGGV